MRNDGERHWKRVDPSSNTCESVILNVLKRYLTSSVTQLTLNRTFAHGVYLSAYILTVMHERKLFEGAFKVYEYESLSCYGGKKLERA